MEGDDYHFKFKVVILGDKAVGKTAFLDCNTILIQLSVSHLAKLNTPNTLRK